MSFAALALVLVALRLRSRVATACIAAGLAFSLDAGNPGIADAQSAGAVGAMDRVVAADPSGRRR